MVEEESLEFIFPEEVRTALASNEVVVWCWACGRSLYEAEKDNVVTNRVAISTAVDHEGAFTVEEHEVDVFKKGDELVN